LKTDFKIPTRKIGLCINKKIQFVHIWY
jgi:hypothetical protein